MVLAGEPVPEEVDRPGLEELFGLLPESFIAARSRPRVPRGASPPGASLIALSSASAGSRRFGVTLSSTASATKSSTSTRRRPSSALLMPEAGPAGRSRRDAPRNRARSGRAAFEVLPGLPPPALRPATHSSVSITRTVQGDLTTAGH